MARQNNLAKEMDAVKREESKQNLLCSLYCFLGREFAVSVYADFYTSKPMGATKHLTLNQVLNAFMDEGWSVRRAGHGFNFEGRCGEFFLNTSTWEVEFGDDGMEVFMEGTVAHMRNVGDKTAYYASLDMEKAKGEEGESLEA
jgi:hypothetical protein